MPKILFIDDERLHRTALRDKFENSGFEVVLAEDGKMGVDTAVEEKPDIIILDILMPVENGKEALQELKNRPETKDIPVIILTAVPEASLQNEPDRTIFALAVEVIQKDQIEMDEIVNKVKKYLKL